MTECASAGRGLARNFGTSLEKDVAVLEQQLDDFDPQVRRTALEELVFLEESGSMALPVATRDVNLHAHTFFSNNGYGYSPLKFAWLAHRAGLAVAGITDFDVLDGLTEFHDAGALLDLKTCVSLETRVFVPQFATRVINSPGEPGIAYHMGVGFPAANPDPFLTSMRSASAMRTREMVAKVNVFLQPVELDYDRDVVLLTPQGNATERHVCNAYERKAATIFPDVQERESFWQEKLGAAPSDSVKLQSLIRAKTMKKGGVGYVQPDSTTFPLLADMNRYVGLAGAIPTVAWLDGMSEGEQAIDEYLDVAMKSGAAALNIIPDRNYKPGVRDQKLENLERIIARCEDLGLPIIVGTEMNAPGLKFVDDFGTDELKPFLSVFLKGACIAYAHSVLQRLKGMGYLSRWAGDAFPTVYAKNEFFAELGKRMTPRTESRLMALNLLDKPSEILEKVS